MGRGVLVFSSHLCNRLLFYFFLKWIRTNNWLMMLFHNAIYRLVVVFVDVVADLLVRLRMTHFGMV
jgi:hypothetical protein